MNTIRIEVEVPEDLEIKPGTDPGETKLYREGCATWFRPDSNLWTHVVMQQIAAAVEARKPKPPKFQVGDVVEWHTMGGAHLAGIVTYVHKLGSCEINGGTAEGTNSVEENALTLVRRAAK